MDNKFTLPGLNVPCHFVADGMLMVPEFGDIMVGGAGYRHYTLHYIPLRHTCVSVLYRLPSVQKDNTQLPYTV